MVVRIGRLEQVGTSDPCLFKTLCVAPVPNPGMITREQNVRYPHSIEFRGSRVGRCVEEAILKTIGEGRLRIAEHARHQSSDRVNKNEGR